MKLTLARLSEHGLLMTNTCNTAQNYRKLLREVIEAESEDNAMTEDKINVYEADCWNHLRNLWIRGGGP